MNPQLNKLMKELAEAVNGLLSESSRVAQVMTAINDEGFEILLLLEATSRSNRQKEPSYASREPVGERGGNSEVTLTMNASDVSFLKSLRIQADDAA